MPKVASTKASKMHQCVTENPGVFSSDGKILHCQPCGKSISCDQKSQVTQHLQGQKHLAAVALNKKRGRQQHLSEAFAAPADTGHSGDTPYFMDICNAFLAADIPFWKLNNPQLKNFLSKYTGVNTPDESTIRKLYLPRCFAQTMDHIREKCGSGDIWISVDETTDSVGRKMGSVVVGAMREDAEFSPSFLLNCQEMSAANHATIARLVNESLHLLWPSGIQYDRVLLLLTDGAAYMKKAATGLSVSYPNMTHVTCVIHMLHRVCETIRALHQDVDRLISNGKKVFVKAPLRIELFRKIAPDVPLPPCPVVTRWGTWLSAAIYYANHFETFFEVVGKLNPDDASSIAVVQELQCKPTLKSDLVYIKSNFTFLIDTIDTLESSNMPLQAAVLKVKKTISAMERLSREKAEKIKQKTEVLFKGNPGFDTMCAIASTLEGEQSESDSLPAGLTVKQLASFKYAKITTCDVERTFSRYKALFRDNRQSFTSENLRMTFVTHCNAVILNE